MVRHIIRHSLVPEKARRLAERAFAHYQKRYTAYAPTLSWRNAEQAELCLRSRGFDLCAAISIHPDHFLIEMDVPLPLLPLSSLAKRSIDREASRWLQTADTSDERL